MTSDTNLAFATLAERAAASGGPLDRISLRDHVVSVDIGAFQTERGAPQRVRFNVVVEVMPVPADLDDDVDRILSYDHVTNAITASLAEERLNLLETLADRVAERILSEPSAVRVFVRIEKLDRGPGALGVEIVRDRASKPGLVDPEIAVSPRVIHLADSAISAPGFSNWLNDLDAPAILCVEAGGLPRPQTGDSASQRRVDLLAVEQNAWCVAAQCDHCLVVSTRTELDWAKRNNRIAVWAPSKIVLDAVAPAPPAAAGPVALSVWFADLVGARDLLVIGAEAPACDTALDVRAVPAVWPDLS